jgi:hypothetical protein
MGYKSRRVSRGAAGICAGAIAAVLAVSSVVSTGASAAGSPRPSDPDQLVPGHYTVSSFNVLGASHTKPGGRRAPGTTRIVWAYQLLQRHHVDVAGFQELQAVQLRRLLAVSGGTWDFYPGLRGRQIDSENSVGWRTDKFDLVQATTVNIPYFDGKPRAMPLVLLREKDSGMMTYFANYHNPADGVGHGNQARFRRAATNVQIALQNQIVVQGIPRVLTGDMNERAPYFCYVSARAPLRAARPTSYRRNGACYANRPRAVDWILGSLWIRFDNYIEDRGPLVDKTTDHPMIISDVTVDPHRLPNGWQVTPPPPVVPRVPG